jgi:hypothetical protein
LALLVDAGDVVLVTLIGPLVAPLGTVALSRDEETNTVALAVVPLNLTVLGFVNPAPLTVTTVPRGPQLGEKPETVKVTVKFDALVTVPADVVTAILPVVAPFGTVAVIWVLLSTWKLAGLPLNLTAVAPVRFAPVIFTGVMPAAPLVGLKLEIFGWAVGAPKLYPAWYVMAARSVWPWSEGWK